MTPPVQQTYDVGLGTSMATSPVWIDLVHEGATIYVFVGGAILLTFRLIAAFKEYRKK